MLCLATLKHYFQYKTTITKVTLSRIPISSEVSTFQQELLTCSKRTCVSPATLLAKMRQYLLITYYYETWSEKNIALL